MPGRNKNGPMGQGPLTGRGMGNCEGAETSLPLGQQNEPWFWQGRGRGPRGWGRGGGRHGWGHCFQATGLPGWMRFGTMETSPQISEEDQKHVLESQAAMLRNQLESVEAHLKEMSKPELQDKP